jgi:hypothetical protein
MAKATHERLKTTTSPESTPNTLAFEVIARFAFGHAYFAFHD